MQVTWTEVVERFGREFRVAKRGTGGLGPLTRDCYSNAGATTMVRGLSYCEGWAWPNSDGSSPVEHAWNLDEEGFVVDRTWQPPGVRYVGVSISPTTLAGLILAANGYGPFLEEWAREADGRG